MKFFYINLEYRRDRREHMETMLTTLGVDYERFNAVQPTFDDIKHGKYKHLYAKFIPRFKNYIDTQTMTRLATGILGVWLSQLNIHQSQVDNSEPYAILEDDVVITQGTLVQLNKMLSWKKIADWDIIRSMWHSSDACEKIIDVHDNSIFKKSRSHTISGGAHFSIFKDASKIANYMLHDHIMSPDCVYSTDILNVYHKRMDVSINNKAFGSDMERKDD